MTGMWMLAIAFFALAVISGQAQASKLGLVFSAHVQEPAKAESPASVPLGETIWVPVALESSLPWKSVQAKLAYAADDPWSTGNAADIEVGEVALDATQQAPQTVLVPVRVTGDGMFVLKGTLRMEAEDENALVNGAKGGFDHPVTAGVFAFEGRVFVGSSISVAMRSMARANVEKSSAYQTLLKSGEQQAARLMEEQEFARFWNTFKHKRPLKPQEKASPKAYVPANIKAGDPVTIKLNWAADSAANTLLPVKGADLYIFDAVTQQGVSSGQVVNGEFTFTAPSDGFRFIGVVQARNGSEFEVRNPSASGSPLFQVGFVNMDEVDIHSANPDLSVDDETMRAFSVFHALQDLHERLPTEIIVRKQTGYHVMFPDSGTFYRPSQGSLHLVLGDAYDWDVIAHEFAHAIADETRMTANVHGGAHSSNINQYDNSGNSGSYQNKDRSLALAWNEAIATWMGIMLLENSPYKGLVANVGDGTYTDTEDVSFTDVLENNATSVRGEDAEAAIYKLLWDITDTAGDANTTATCANNCTDLMYQSFRDVVVATMMSKGYTTIADHYPMLYLIHVGEPVGGIDTGVVTADRVNATHALGVTYAEFGIAPHLSEADNANALAGLTQHPPVPPTFVWSQHNTGTMPGLDDFELLLLGEAGDEVVHYFKPSASVSKNGSQFSVTLTTAETDALVAAFQKYVGTKVHLFVKGTASGQGVANGAIATGPYYSNAIVLDAPAEPKRAVIAVDSSGSNSWTDPQNLRIGAAQKMLDSMAHRNAEIAAGTAPNAGEQPTMVAALDFDSRVTELADFTLAQDLAARNIFSAIDSWGGTDIAYAITYATGKLNPRGAPRGAWRPFPNTAKTYVLTDMDNNAGMAPVITAIRNSGAAGIPVNVGHLVPLLTKATVAKPADLRGEPDIQRKVAEPMDALAEALLATGGSYAIIENAEAQDAWVALMNELNNSNPDTRTEVNLPLDVKLYGMAVADDGKAEPTYIFTATRTGPATVTVDGKGNFVPAISVNGAGAQTSLGQDLYEVAFMAQAGTSYRILLNEAASAAGLYSIVVRQQANAVPQEAVPVPVGGPATVVLMGLLLLLGAGWAQQRSRRTRG